MLIFKNSLTRKYRTPIIGNFSNKVKKILKNRFKVTKTRTMKIRIRTNQTTTQMILKKKGQGMILERVVEKRERIKILKNNRNLKS